MGGVLELPWLSKQQLNALALGPASEFDIDAIRTVASTNRHLLATPLDDLLQCATDP